MQTSSACPGTQVPATKAAPACQLRCYDKKLTEIIKSAVVYPDKPNLSPIGARHVDPLNKPRQVGDAFYVPQNLSTDTHLYRPDNNSSRPCTQEHDRLGRKRSCLRQSKLDELSSANIGQRSGQRCDGQCAGRVRVKLNSPAQVFKWHMPVACCKPVLAAIGVHRLSCPIPAPCCRQGRRVLSYCNASQPVGFGPKPAVPLTGVHVLKQQCSLSHVTEGQRRHLHKQAGSSPCT